MFLGIVGLITFSAMAGALIAVSFTPAVAVTSATVKSTVGIFDDLPDFIEIGTQPQQNRIFARKNGKPVQIATVFDQNREEVAWNQVSRWAKYAAVSGEDRRFYTHNGVDVTGVIRAAVKTFAKKAPEGASTITQQLVKNILIQQSLTLKTEEERDAAFEAAAGGGLDRKIREMKLAISMEKKYTKKQILLAYLNITGFGGTTYGIQAAAEQFYGKGAAYLTIAQSASLVAIVQNPNSLSLNNPKNYKANKERRDFILRAMYAEKNITSSQLKKALDTPVSKKTVKIREAKNGCMAANDYAKYFCDYVLRSVPVLTSLGKNAKQRAANWKRGGYDVYTTLDMTLQTAAQKTSWQYAPRTETIMKLGSATVSVQAGTGRILVMAQNKKFNNSSAKKGSSFTAVNYSSDAAMGGSTGFQPGSTYKVFTLINWLQNGHSLQESVNASARTENMAQFTDSCSGPYGGPYPFRNDEGESGNWTVAHATARSVNGAFLSMAKQLDLCGIKKTAESLGVHRADGNDLLSTPSSVLGTNEVAPLTMAAAYAGIASGGVYCAPIAVDKIVSPSGKKLKGQDAKCHRALDQKIADTAASGMENVMLGGGTGNAANPGDGTSLIGKTGTTDQSNHTWMVGASRRVATAVWVGNIEGFYPLRSYSANGIGGSLLRHVIWRQTMQTVDAKYPAPAFPAAASMGSATPNKDAAKPGTGKPGTGMPGKGKGRQ